MRPITNFTLHAMLAAALAALAASSAAAGPEASGEMVVRLSGSASLAGQDEQIPIRSFQWGSDGFQSPGEEAIKPVQSRYYEEWAVEVEVGEGSGSQAAPMAQGSLIVKVQTSWPACRVGDRYPELELADGATRFRLREVTVSSCGAGEGFGNSVTFAYDKLG